MQPMVPVPDSWHAPPADPEAAVVPELAAPTSFEQPPSTTIEGKVVLKEQPEAPEEADAERGPALPPWCLWLAFLLDVMLWPLLFRAWRRRRAKRGQTSIAKPISTSGAGSHEVVDAASTDDSSTRCSSGEGEVLDAIGPPVRPFQSEESNTQGMAIAATGDEALLQDLPLKKPEDPGTHGAATIAFDGGASLEAPSRHELVLAEGLVDIGNQGAAASATGDEAASEVMTPHELGGVCGASYQSTAQHREAAVPLDSRDSDAQGVASSAMYEEACSLATSTQELGTQDLASCLSTPQHLAHSGALDHGTQSIALTAIEDEATSRATTCETGLQEGAAALSTQADGWAGPEPRVGEDQGALDSGTQSVALTPIEGEAPSRATTCEPGLQDGPAALSTQVESLQQETASLSAELETVSQELLNAQFALAELQSHYPPAWYGGGDASPDDGVDGSAASPSARASQAESSQGRAAHHRMAPVRSAPGCWPRPLWGAGVAAEERSDWKDEAAQREVEHTSGKPHENGRSFSKPPVAPADPPEEAAVACWGPGQAQETRPPTSPVVQCFQFLQKSPRKSGRAEHQQRH